MSFFKFNTFSRKIKNIIKTLEIYIYEKAIKMFDQMIDKLKTLFRDLIYVEGSISISRAEEVVRLHKKNKFKSRL